MAETLKIFIDKIADPVILTLLAVICILAWLLVRAMGRIDELVNALRDNGTTLAKLTVLVEQLVYGRRKE